MRKTFACFPKKIFLTVIAPMTYKHHADSDDDAARERKDRAAFYLQQHHRFSTLLASAFPVCVTTTKVVPCPSIRNTST
jgi:hypothetical protein